MYATSQITSNIDILSILQHNLVLADSTFNFLYNDNETVYNQRHNRIIYFLLQKLMLFENRLKKCFVSYVYFI